MNTIQQQTGYENFLALMAREFERVEKDALFEVRKKALDEVVKAGLPTRKAERYKYSNPEKIFRADFESKIKSDIREVDIEKVKIDNAINLVFVNGVFKPKFSDIADADGVHIFSVKEEINNNPKLTELFSKENNVNDIFANMNMALFADGIFITIDESKKVEKLIHLIHVTSVDNVLGTIRHVVEVKKDAKVTLAESVINISEHKNSFSNIAIDIHAEENVEMKYYRLQDGGQEDQMIHNIHVYQAENSNIDINTITLSGKWIRNNVYSALAEKYAHVNIHGLSVVDGDSHIDNHTYVDHISPECSSDQVYKGVWYDKAMGVFNGKIYVHKDAQKTEAKQYSQNMLMNKGAKVNAKPELEIYANDVKCAHGSTNSKIDKNALFYLKSRGIGEEKARALMLQAFMYDIIDTIQHDVWRSYIESQVKK